MIVFDRQGKRISLGHEVGRGGEAVVYRAGDGGAWLAKIYTPAPRTNYPDKLVWMVEHSPENPTQSQSHPSLAWPVSLLYDSPGRNQRLAGYLMPFIRGAVPILEVLNPKRRLKTLPRFNRRYLHRTARNLASALSALHSCGYVAGDLNESNILVTPSALVTLIDTDSFQVVQEQDGRQIIHPCPVGKMEYMPRELQGQPLDKFFRRSEHDAFSLGVIIFQLLMEGSHPFRAQWLGKGDPPPIEARIGLGAFPYTSTPGGLFRPPKGAPNLNHIHPSVVELFRRCFIDGHKDPKFRPEPAAWELALIEAERALVLCRAGHIYSNHLAGCPFCPASSQPAAPPLKAARPATSQEYRSWPNRPSAPPTASTTRQPRTPPVSVAPPKVSTTRQPRTPPASAGPARVVNTQPPRSTHSAQPSPQASQFSKFLQSRFQQWAQSRVSVFNPPVFTPQPSTVPGSQPGTSPASTTQPSTPAIRRRRSPLRTSGLRQMLFNSFAYGAGTGAAIGLLPGALIGWAAFAAGNVPDWSLLWAFGGAAGATLRGTRSGHRLGLLVAQYFGWKRFWLGFGLLVGAGLGGLLSLPFILAIFPVFIGIFTGARLGLAAGNRIWQAGNRLGWERLWAITGGITAALVGAGGAYLVGSSPIGELANALTSYLARGLTDLNLSSLVVLLFMGGLSGAWGGAFAGMFVDLFARLSRLVD